MANVQKTVKKIAKKPVAKRRRAPSVETELRELAAAVIAEVRESLQAHGGDVELVGVEGSEVRLRFVGACGACMYASGTLAAIAQKMRAKAPAGTKIVLVR